MRHFEYVFPDGQMFVYYIDHGFKLVKETSPTGNYLPVRSRAADTFCYAAVAHRRARIEVRHLYHNLCVPQW